MTIRFSPAERMVLARVKLLESQPFFGTIAMRLRLVEAEQGPLNPCGTMATDGVSITWSPSFLAQISDKGIEGVIAHEVMHVAMKHHFRRKRRDPRKFNIACDATINNDLKEAGFKLPDGGVDMPQFKNMAAETIYDLLPDDPSGGAGWGQVMDHPSCNGGSEADQTHGEQEVNILVAQAAALQEKFNKAKSKGEMPGWMKRLVDEIVAPEVKWQDVLRRFITTRIPHDYSWSRLNRRFVHQGVHLPGVLKDGLGELVFLFDTSGSMTKGMLTRIYGECNSIVEDCRPERVHAIACDASVGNYRVLEDGESLRPDIFVGGGGSDFRPAFKKLEDDGVKPAACVVFSDMMIDFPEEAPGYPVLMVATTDHESPAWGTERIRLRHVGG